MPGVTYPTIGKHINDVSIGIEILPEASPTDFEANIFEYEFGTCCSQPGDLSLLEPQPHALISSEYNEDPFTLSNYAAIEMKVDFSGKTSTPVTDDTVRIVVDDLSAYSGSNRNTLTSINNEVLTIIVTSMNEQLKPYEMRFAAVLGSANTFTSTPIIISTEFYDINGNSVIDTTNFNVVLR